MPLHITKRDRAWLRYATGRAEQPVHGCRPPTPIERLAAAGYTRRVSAGLVWFEDGNGKATPTHDTLHAAITAALEAL